MVAHDSKHAPTDSLGYAERLDHLNLVRGGAACYLVMCLAKDPDSQPRAIASFNRDRLFVGGKILEDGGNWYMEIANSVPVRGVLGA